MIDAGVNEGDVLVIDRSLEPQNGDMAVCFVDGEFTLKHLRFSSAKGTDGMSGKKISLVPANDRYPVIEVTEGVDFKMWGVVTYVIKKVRLLQPGTCIAFGSGFKLPSLIKLDMPNPAPSSSSCDISSVWFLDRK